MSVNEYDGDDVECEIKSCHLFSTVMLLAPRPLKPYDAPQVVRPPRTDLVEDYLRMFRIIFVWNKG